MLFLKVTSSLLPLSPLFGIVFSGELPILPGSSYVYCPQGRPPAPPGPAEASVRCIQRPENEVYLVSFPRPRRQDV